MKNLLCSAVSAILISGCVGGVAPPKWSDFIFNTEWVSPECTADNTREKLTLDGHTMEYETLYYTDVECTGDELAYGAEHFSSFTIVEENYSLKYVDIAIITGETVRLEHAVPNTLTVIFQDGTRTEYIGDL